MHGQTSRRRSRDANVHCGASTTYIKSWSSRPPVGEDIVGQTQLYMYLLDSGLKYMLCVGMWFCRVYSEQTHTIECI